MVVAVVVAAVVMGALLLVATLFKSNHSAPLVWVGNERLGSLDVGTTMMTTEHLPFSQGAMEIPLGS